MPRAYGLQAALPFELLVRRVERIPLGTPYPRVVELIPENACSRALAGQCQVVVDGTGAGTGWWICCAGRDWDARSRR